MKPRVFFGTMFSGEAEFAECKAAIESQEGLSRICHHVIDGSEIGERNAHNALWSAWNEAKGAFDLFVKVDADTVVKKPDAIAKVWQLFEVESRLTGVQVRLHDYFTDGLIAGLNFFSPRVIFNTSPELYCDRVDTNHNVVMKGESVSHLEPIGWHCTHPHDAQAFHFGLHRGMKGQHRVISDTFRAFSVYRDRARAMALVGAGYGSQLAATGGTPDYRNPAVSAAIQSASSLTTQELSRLVDLTGPTWSL